MASETRLAGSAELASWLGISERSVQRLATDGVLSIHDKTGRGNRYLVKQAVGEYIAFLNGKIDEASGSNTMESLEEKKLKAEVDFKENKAKIAGLQLQELQGKMHRSEDVEALTDDLVYSVRNAFLALPGRLAVDLAELSDPAQVSERLEQEVFDILRELSSYRYDPDKYRERVMSREGWDWAGGDSDED